MADHSRRFKCSLCDLVCTTRIEVESLSDGKERLDADWLHRPRRAEAPSSKHRSLPRNVEMHVQYSICMLPQASIFTTAQHMYANRRHASLSRGTVAVR